MEPRCQANPNDFRLKIPEFEDQVDPNEFLEWIHMAKNIFQHKEVLDYEKIKLVALRLRKYTSLCSTNPCAKRITCLKSKIRMWDKMKAMLMSQFLPPTYIEDSYSQFNYLTQGGLNVEEYTREFERIMIKCDIRVLELDCWGRLTLSVLTQLNYNNTPPLIMCVSLVTRLSNKRRLNCPLIMCSVSLHLGTILLTRGVLTHI